MALRTADIESASYVLAQDPDADRFCAAERGYDFYCGGFATYGLSPCRSNGEWTIFTGDQLGTLLAARTLDTYKSSGKSIGRHVP
jgi:phosphomannomutase